MRVRKQGMVGRHRATVEQDIVQLYYYIKFRGIAAFHTIAFISVTSTKPFDAYKPWPKQIFNKIAKIM